MLVDIEKRARKREEMEKKGRRYKRAKGYWETILFSVISCLLRETAFFFFFSTKLLRFLVLAVCTPATYWMRGCAEIKYSQRVLRPPSRLVVAWNSFDFIFTLICLGNQRYSSRFYNVCNVYIHICASAVSTKEVFTYGTK